MEQPNLDVTFANRVGGKYAVRLAPWLWSIPLMVFIIPLASRNAWDSLTTLIIMIGYSGLAWMGFGSVLYIAHKTVLANRDIKPASLTTILLIGALAGLTRSLMLGDWFTFLTLSGDYSGSKVLNAIFTGWAWMILSALIVSENYMFKDEYSSLLKQQNDLLINSQEWLNQVHNQRERIISGLRTELDQRWDNIRTQIHYFTDAGDHEWEHIARNISMSSRETVHTLASSLRSPEKLQLNTRTPLREAFYLITHLPLIDPIRPSLTLLALGTLPLMRFLGIKDGVIVAFNAAILISLIQVAARWLIGRLPKLGPTIYLIMVIAAASLSFFLIPSLERNGLSANAALAFAFIGLSTSLITIPVFSFVSLSRNRRNETLQDLKQQNALLASLNQANSQQSFEAALDISSYLQMSVSRALESAQQTVETGIAQKDPSAARAGIAVIESIYSNIFGKYSESENLKLPEEIAELAKIASNTMIVTYSVTSTNHAREIVRRVLVVVNELLNQAIDAKALRMHLEFQSVETGIEFFVEVNLPASWIPTTSITADVLTTATQNNWSIDNTKSGCIIKGLIKTPVTQLIT